jgi:hypothetical protein
MFKSIICELLVVVAIANIFEVPRNLRSPIRTTSCPDVMCTAKKPGCTRTWPKDKGPDGCLKHMCGLDFCKEPNSCPIYDCMYPRPGCKTDWSKSKEKNKLGCQKYPCGITKCTCPVARCAAPKIGCKRTYSKELNSRGCPKHLCGIDVCKPICAIPMCIPPPRECKVTSDDSKTKRGCPAFPCGRVSCPTADSIFKDFAYKWDASHNGKLELVELEK